MVLVRAMRMGYYEHKRQREGSEFLMEIPEEQNTPSWVEVIEENPKSRIQIKKSSGKITGPVPNPAPVKAKEIAAPQDQTVI